MANKVLATKVISNTGSMILSNFIDLFSEEKQYSIKGPLTIQNTGDGYIELINPVDKTSIEIDINGKFIIHNALCRAYQYVLGSRSSSVYLEGLFLISATVESNSNFRFHCYGMYLYSTMLTGDTDRVEFYT